MKKAALFLTIIFAIGLCVVFFILHRLGPTTAARLVPNTTLALLDLPDLAATSQRWKTSSINKIIKEPEMQAFLERPLDRFHQWSSSSADATTIEDLIFKIKPGRFFAAIEQLQESSAWVAGCQFFGTATDAEKGFVRLHEFLDKRFGTGEKVLLDARENQGEIITQSSHGSLVVYSALRGNWFFVSNSLEAIKNSLDFSAGRRSEKESLFATDLYKKNREKLLSEADIFFFIKPDQAMQELPYLRKLLRNDSTLTKAQSLGLSTSLSDEGMKEILFCGGDFPKGDSLTHDGIALTQPTTLGFIERTNEWDKVFNQLQDNKGLPTAFIQALSPAGIDLSSLAGFLKPETTFVINWPQGHTFPTGFISIPATDSLKVNSWMEQAAARLNVTLQAEGEVHFISMPQLSEGLKPTMADARGWFFIGTDPAVIKQASGQVEKKSPQGTLVSSPDFAKAETLYHQANEVFAYFSTKELFERLYEKVRPGLLLGGSFMPGISTTVDFAKLPSAAAISKYLTPIFYAQSHVDEGLLIQSTGALSFTPLFFSANMAYTTIMKKKAAEGTATSSNTADPLATDSSADRSVQDEARQRQL